MATTLYITGVPGVPVFSYVFSGLVDNLRTLRAEKDVTHDWDEKFGFVRIDFADGFEELAKAMLELNPFFLTTTELKGDELEKYCQTAWKMPLGEFKFNPVVMG